MKVVTFLVLMGFGAAVARADVPQFGGVWLVEKPQAEVKTTAGKAPPLTAEAAKVFAERKKSKADDPVALCLPHGVPRLLSIAKPIQILQKPKQVTVLYEANHQARLFYIDEPVPGEDALPDITYNGSSYAKWDGNALVVNTIAFNDQTWLDDAGLPHGLALKTTERYELAGADRLKVTVTITDPENYTAPWEMQVTYKRQPRLRMSEDACSEKFWHPGQPGSGSG